jgi:hypothetical protein
MSALKIAVLAAALTAGAAATAEAQPYGYWHGHQGYGYVQPQPQYVHPKILRKQAEMEARVRQKYGYTGPSHAYQYGHGDVYGQRHQRWGHQPHPYYHHQPRGRVIYQHGW